VSELALTQAGLDVTLGTNASFAETCVDGAEEPRLGEALPRLETSWQLVGVANERSFGAMHITGPKPGRSCGENPLSVAARYSTRIRREPLDCIISPCSRSLSGYLRETAEPLHIDCTWGMRLTRYAWPHLALAIRAADGSRVPNSLSAGQWASTSCQLLHSNPVTTFRSSHGMWVPEMLVLGL